MASENFEDYEDGWLGSPDDHVFDLELSATVVADFTPGAGTAETFTAGSGAGWDTTWDNELTSTDAAAFDSGETPQDFEDFEEVYFRFQVQVSDPANDLFVTSDGSAHGLGVGFNVTFETDGTPPAGITEGVLYDVNATPTSSTFKIEDPANVVVNLTDFGVGELFLVPDQTIYWVDELP